MPAHAAQSLRTAGFAVVPDFVSAPGVRSIKADVAALRAEGRFAVAGVGDAGTNRVADNVRRCEQCFLFPTFKHGGGGHQPARRALYAAIEDVKSSLQAATGEALDGLLTEGLFAASPYLQIRLKCYSFCGAK